MHSRRNVGFFRAVPEIPNKCFFAIVTSLFYLLIVAGNSVVASSTFSNEIENRELALKYIGEARLGEARSILIQLGDPWALAIVANLDSLGFHYSPVSSDRKNAIIFQTNCSSQQDNDTCACCAANILASLAKVKIALHSRTNSFDSKNKYFPLALKLQIMLAISTNTMFTSSSIMAADGAKPISRWDKKFLRSLQSNLPGALTKLWYLLNSFRAFPNLDVSTIVSNYKSVSKLERLLLEILLRKSKLHSEFRQKFPDDYAYHQLNKLEELDLGFNNEFKLLLTNNPIVSMKNILRSRITENDVNNVSDLLCSVDLMFVPQSYMTNKLISECREYYAKVNQ